MRQGEQKRRADEGGTGQQQDDFLADDRPAISEPGPALVEQPSREWIRAATIAYTALWQLKDADPGEELDEYRETRLDLRRRLDASRLEAEASRHPAPAPGRPQSVAPR